MGRTGVSRLQCVLPHMGPGPLFVEQILDKGPRLHQPLGFIAEFSLNNLLGREPQPSPQLETLRWAVMGTTFPYSFRAGGLPGLPGSAG